MHVQRRFMRTYLRTYCTCATLGLLQSYEKNLTLATSMNTEAWNFQQSFEPGFRKAVAIPFPAEQVGVVNLFLIILVHVSQLC